MSDDMTAAADRPTWAGLPALSVRTLTISLVALLSLIIVAGPAAAAPPCPLPDCAWAELYELPFDWWEPEPDPWGRSNPEPTPWRLHVDEAIHELRGTALVEIAQHGRGVELQALTVVDRAGQIVHRARAVTDSRLGGPAFQIDLGDLAPDTYGLQAVADGAGEVVAIAYQR